MTEKMILLTYERKEKQFRMNSPLGGYFMENVEHFGALTPRMKAFREEVLDEKPYVDAESFHSGSQRAKVFHVFHKVTS